MKKGSKMTKEQRNNLSVACKGRIPWNKGLTKDDERVLKNISGSARKTQFKPGPRPKTCREGNPNWKGGKIIHGGIGYIFIRNPEHPASVNGYVMEHRIVMEKYLGRYLTEKEVVHHINGNRTDNRIENLVLIKNQCEHFKMHIEIWRKQNEKGENKII